MKVSKTKKKLRLSLSCFVTHNPWISSQSELHVSTNIGTLKIYSVVLQVLGLKANAEDYDGSYLSVKLKIKVK